MCRASLVDWCREEAAAPKRAGGNLIWHVSEATSVTRDRPQLARSVHQTAVHALRVGEQNGSMTGGQSRSRAAAANATSISLGSASSSG